MCSSTEYRVLSKKGEGTFSEVLKVEHVHSGQCYAVKCMKSLYPSIKHVNELREIQALRRLNPHPNIVGMEEILYDPETGRLAIVLELMQMNVYELIRHRREPLEAALVCSLMYQLLTAICHMHDHGVFHRDIKPENVLLVNSNTLKVADLGSCRGLFSQPPYTEYISTRWYRAPECLLTNGYYDYKMDIWGIGCVFYELASLQPLFPGANELDQIEKIHAVMGTPSKHLLTAIQQRGGAATPNIKFSERKGSGYRHLLPKALVSDDMVDLIDQMLIYNPDKRITARQALNHRYFDAVRAREKGREAGKEKEEKKEKEKPKGAAAAEEERREAESNAPVKPVKPVKASVAKANAGTGATEEAEEEYAPDVDHATTAEQQQLQSSKEEKEVEVSVESGSDEAGPVGPSAEKTAALVKEAKRKKKKDKVRDIIVAADSAHSPHQSPKHASATTLQPNTVSATSSSSTSSHLSSTLQSPLPVSSALAAPHPFSQTHPQLSAAYAAHHAVPVVAGKAAEIVPLPQLQHHQSPKAKAVPLLSSTSNTSSSLLPAAASHSQHSHPQPAAPAVPLLVPLSVSSELHSHSALYPAVRATAVSQSAVAHGGVTGTSLSSLPAALGWKEKRRKRRKKHPADPSHPILNTTQEVKTHNSLSTQYHTAHGTAATAHPSAYSHQPHPHPTSHYHKQPTQSHPTEMPPLLIAATAVPTNAAASHLHPPAYHHAYSIVGDAAAGGKKAVKGVAGAGVMLGSAVGVKAGGGGGMVGFGSGQSHKPSHFLSKLHTAAPALYQKAAR